MAVRQARVRTANRDFEGRLRRPEVLAEVFGLDADVVADPLLGHPVVLPRGNGDRR